MDRSLICFLLFGLAGSSSTLALGASGGGHEVGNGGNVVKCQQEDGTETYEVLDVYEARELRGIGLDLDEFKGDAEAKAEKVIKNRLARFDPTRADQFLPLLYRFELDSTILHDRTFPSVDDSHHFPPADHCVVVQTVIQREPVFPEDTTYLINGKIWDKLDESQKAVLMLHEIIYYDALRHGHQNSTATRYFNSLLFSSTLEELDQQDYQFLLGIAKLASIQLRDEKNGYQWEISKSVFNTFNEAKEYCAKQNSIPFSFNLVTPEGMKVVRESYIGKYHLEDRWFWIEKNPQGEGAVYSLAKGNEKEKEVPAVGFPVICIQKLAEGEFSDEK